MKKNNGKLMQYIHVQQESAIRNERLWAKSANWGEKQFKK